MTNRRRRTGGGGALRSYVDLDAIRDKIGRLADGLELKMTWRYLMEQASKANQPADVLLFATELIRINKEERELTPKHRRHISVAFKKIACKFRDAWHSIKLERNPGNQRDLANGYRKELERELVAFVRDATELCEKMLSLLPNHHVESNVFFLHMVADLHRYVAECDSSISLDGGLGGKGARSSSSETVMKMYSRASDAADALPANNPVRLGVALSVSVFCHDILGDEEQARQLATASFNGAIQKMDLFHDSRYKDSALLMQLLRDNLALWKQNESNHGRDHADLDNLLGADLL